MRMYKTQLFTGFGPQDLAQQLQSRVWLPGEEGSRVFDGFLIGGAKLCDTNPGLMGKGTEKQKQFTAGSYGFFRFIVTRASMNRSDIENAFEVDGFLRNEQTTLHVNMGLKHGDWANDVNDATRENCATTFAGYELKDEAGSGDVPWQILVLGPFPDRHSCPDI